MRDDIARARLKRVPAPVRDRMMAARAELPPGPTLAAAPKTRGLFGQSSLGVWGGSRAGKRGG